MGDKNQAHTYAIVTLVLGIVSLALIFLGWGAILGLVCGIISIVFAKKTQKASAEKESMATAGFVCGIIGTVLSGIALIVLLIVGSSIFSGNKGLEQKVTDIINEANDMIDEQHDENKIIEKNNETSVQENDSVSDNSKVNELKEKLQTKIQERTNLEKSISDLTDKVQTAITNGDTSSISGIQEELLKLNQKLSTLITEITNLEQEIAGLE